MKISEVARERIRSVEAEISRNNYETAIAFDTDGNIVFEKTTYDENNVDFTDEELSAIKGCIVTHNHSYDEDSERSGVKSTSSFSSDDLIVAYQCDFIEVRMVVNDETYTFRWNNPDKCKANDFFTEMDRIEKEAIKRIDAAGDKAELAVAEYENNPSMHSYFEKERLATAYFNELKFQADEMNDFISKNRHIGYIFRKE